MWEMRGYEVIREKKKTVDHTILCYMLIHTPRWSQEVLKVLYLISSDTSDLISCSDA